MTWSNRADILALREKRRWQARDDEGRWSRGLMGAVAIIPARGGSRGLPRKNVLPIAGKPLIGWTIEAAKAAACVQRVVVSTDSPEIADVARGFEAEVIWRPAELSGDLSSSESALLHALGSLNESPHTLPDITVFLQCTAPLISHEDIDGTVEALVKSEADTAVAVAEFHHFIWERNGKGDWAAVNHDRNVRHRRQDRAPQYLETGSVYAMRTAGFLRHKHRFFGRTACHVVPSERALEIDGPADYRMAQLLLEDRLRRRRREALPETIGHRAQPRRR